MEKFLIIRFSSIGDIVLTTPVIRCLRKKYPNAEIHYITKSKFKGILADNPHIDQIITIEKEITEVLDQLKKQDYDFIIDLHHNLRTFRLKRKLGGKSASFPKMNWEKFLLTNFKINRLPKTHIVDRYFKAVAPLDVMNDALGLDYFIPQSANVNLSDYQINKPFIAACIGAQFATKRMPVSKWIKLIAQLELPIVLLGGPTDVERANEIQKSSQNTINLCGDLSLDQSASVVQQASAVITHDTGMMHIAAALKRPIISIWGNTVPDFGMYPYRPDSPNSFTTHEVQLKCRPCSKIGHKSCPKKHFKCMLDQNIEAIVKATNSFVK